jgi:signal transduction histidine kinase
VRLRDPEPTRRIGRQLQTADRLSAISRLTKGVAHEVKNPLNAILMHVELARLKLSHQDYDLDPQMDIIASEIMRLDRVVKTFLDFTRPVQLNLSEMRVRDLMEEIASLARPQAAAGGIAIVEQIQVEDSTITVDVDLIKQAMLNVVVNAIEAMPEGGTLRFEAALRGDDAEIRIADTGPGIPPDLKEKIYDLYFTTREHGSGIGLAMTFRIVQLHDGTIDFTSDPGHGTTFMLRFPVSAASV